MWFLTSTKKLWYARKSAPSMGWLTSAIVKIQWYGRQRPRLRVSKCWPKVATVTPLAAWRWTPHWRCCLSDWTGGITLISAPVSTRKQQCDSHSWTNNTRLRDWPGALVVISDWPVCFPSPKNKADYTWLPSLQNACGTNTNQLGK